ncbi:HDOD domain-containing protein [Pigmentibacter sp. JX0631]|uniref:HDOD domain-containing protein n=1 Tax=Pigmentibacter sp. JX0631 TaxID=2976982 RepID=UPI00246977C1|nr:HDOD domain-containing protein [Pigmentibacter sp. JX0631]WGL60511.1 HDOD domain-containing protein [Pigmentibacter sp. JX0631]
MQIENVQIPPLSENIIACLSSIYKNDVSYESLCEKISKDMSLIQKVFDIANSQLYSKGIKTNNLKEAIIRIGITNLTTILTSEYYSQYKKIDGIAFFKLKEFNQHSIFVSKLCFEIGKSLNLDRKFDLMIAGMFHDIGLLIRALSQPEKMEILIEKSKNDKINFYTSEINIQLLTHDQLGANLLEKWGFNRQVVDLVKHHHTPTQHRTSSIDYLSKEFDILELSNQISSKYSFGFHNNDPHVKISQILLDKIAISKNGLNSILKDVVLNLNVFSNSLYI